MNLNQQHSESQISISDSLAKVFLQFHGSGSIIVRGNCTDAKFINDEVPRGPTGNFSSVEDALAAWKSLVPRLRIRRDANGMLRVSDTTASPDLLKVKVNDLHSRVFNSDEAVGTVLNTKEVQLFFLDNGISEASTMIGLAFYDGSRLPRSVWHLHEVVVGNAFDAAVKKFPGVWLYTECVMSDGKLVHVRAIGF